MSLLIKGMEMPKDGAYWCEICVSGEIATITIHGEDRKSFHLVPVPPHGRLGDLDKLADNMRSATAGMEHRAIIMHEIRRAPTIIQAVEDET